MDFETKSDELSFFTVFKDFKDISIKNVKKDLMAGGTVALLTVPQTMAYALMAGLPLSSGVFAAIFSAIVASFFGSSRHLILGPSNAIAILLQTGTSQILNFYYPDLIEPERSVIAVSILTQLTLLISLFHMLAAFFRLGNLIKYVSHSVIVGYLLGVACAVIVSQLYPFLGIEPLRGGYTVFEKGFYLAMHMASAHQGTIIVGCFSLFLLIALKRMDNRLPAGLLMLLTVSFFVFAEAYIEESGFFGLFYPIAHEQAHHIAVVGDTGVLQDLSPVLIFPIFNLRIINELLPFAFAVALLSILESSAVAKSISSQSGQRYSVNQEILGLSLGHLTSAFTGAMPISGSPSRSFLNYQMGAKTRLSAIFSALFVAVLIYSLEPLIVHVPLAALSALLLVTVVNIVDRRQMMLCLKATNSDAWVLWMTFFSCLVFSLDIAFYIGIALSITLYLRHASSPQVVEFQLDDKGRIYPLGMEVDKTIQEVKFIKIEGELFFGAAEAFQTLLQYLMSHSDHYQVLILQLKNARDLDATGCLALQQLNHYLRRDNKAMIICGITPHVWEVLANSGLSAELGSENLFRFADRYPTLHMQNAYHRALLLIEENSSNCRKEPSSLPELHDAFAAQTR